MQLSLGPPCKIWEHFRQHDNTELNDHQPQVTSDGVYTYVLTVNTIISQPNAETVCFHLVILAVQTHTHTRLTALCPGLPGWADTRKVKPIWILLKQETVSDSGISWAICKSAHHSRQITMPAPHLSVFYRMDALPAAQPTVSKHWRHSSCSKVVVNCSRGLTCNVMVQHPFVRYHSLRDGWWLIHSGILNCLWDREMDDGKLRYRVDLLENVVGSVNTATRDTRFN